MKWNPPYQLLWRPSSTLPVAPFGGEPAADVTAASSITWQKKSWCKNAFAAVSKHLASHVACLEPYYSDELLSVI